MFSIRCGEQSLELNNGVKLPLQCGLEIANARHSRLSSQSIQYQKELIEASCYFSSDPKESNANQTLCRQKANTADTYTNTKEDNFKSTANQIITKLSERSHHSPDYGRSWIGINILEDYGKMQL